jgi:tRNA(Ile)-lysidine synthase
VLHKLLRGAWTEGLSGIHPVLEVENTTVLRPFLEASHATNELWLQALQQPWREDETNQDMAYTRNRIRHQLLPLLRTFNPRITEQLARLASISADEEAYWQRELERLLPPLLLPGKPTRGGGRSTSTHPEEETVAMEQARLRSLHPAVARRVLRAAARRLGSRLSFEHTERVMALLQPETAHSVSRAVGRKARFDLPGGITVERSLREIRLTRSPAGPPAPTPAYVFFVPGEVSAPEYGLNLQAERVAPNHAESHALRATLRAWRPGDRVTLRYSRGPKKVTEVLDRLQVIGAERQGWPVVELDGKILWMRGVEVEAPEFRFTVEFLPE